MEPLPLHVEPLALAGAGPLDVLEALGPAERPFLLESGMDGRWSFLGAAGPPVLVVRGRSYRLIGADGAVRDREGDPFEAARDLWARFRSGPAATPFPFRGGLVGWFGYELSRAIERLPGRAFEDLGLPHLCLAAATEVVAIDHREGRAWVSVLGEDGPARARRLRERLEQARPRPAPVPPPLESLLADTACSWSDPLDRGCYAGLVSEARRRIHEGRVFEVCLTRRLETSWTAGGLPLYRALRALNPAPFAAYLDFPEAIVASSSPERFLRVDASGRVESRPIKGTRPRGRTPEEDRRFRQELADSEKDRAENLMIVDLVRNDLGRVCRFGTIQVPRPLAIEAHPTVFQLVSEVAGELAPGFDAIDALRAAFPPGSMTGAPKIEAMKTIDELEPVARGVYSGALGYLDAGGGLDLSVVIRTFVLAGTRLTFSTGGAVVSDSDPTEEYEETVAKARALLAAAEWARRGLGGG